MEQLKIKNALIKSIIFLMESIIFPLIVILLSQGIDMWKQNHESNQMLHRATICFRNQDYFSAFDILNNNSLVSNAMAQKNIGYLYECGLGIKKNEDVARTYYIRAIHLGAMEAYDNLIHLNLSTGFYKTRMDFLRAIKISAESGNTHSKQFLASLLAPNLSDEELKQKSNELADRFLEFPDEVQLSFLEDAETTKTSTLQPYVDVDLVNGGELLWIEPVKEITKKVGTYPLSIINSEGKKEIVRKPAYAKVKYGYFHSLKFNRQDLFDSKFFEVD